MYKIAVFDKTKVVSDIFKSLLSEILNSRQVNYQMKCYETTESLMVSIINMKKCYDLYVINMGSDCEEALQVAGILRKMNQISSIVFVAETEKFAIQGYEFDALSYLITPITKTDVEKIITKDIVRHCLMLPVYKRESTVLIRINDIIFIEVINRTVIIHLKNGDEVKNHGSIKDIASRLPQHMFLRCHQSFIVNINYIYEMKYTSIIMMDKKAIPISRKYQPEVRKCVTNRFIQCPRSSRYST